MIGFRSQSEAPEVVATPPVVVTEGASKKKRKARGNPCPTCQGSGVAESQQKIGFDVTNPQLAPGPLPIPNPLPYAVARAIALHRIVETVAASDCARPIWLALHESARGSLTGVDVDLYRRYRELREQSIYGRALAGLPNEDEIHRSMIAARDALASLLSAMPQGDDALRLELALCEEALTLARTEIDHSEAFARMVRGLLGARS